MFVGAEGDGGEAVGEVHTCQVVVDSGEGGMVTVLVLLVVVDGGGVSAVVLVVEDEAGKGAGGVSAVHLGCPYTSKML